MIVLFHQQVKSFSQEHYSPNLNTAIAMPVSMYQFLIFCHINEWRAICGGFVLNSSGTAAT